MTQFRYGDPLPPVGVDDDDAGTFALDPASVLPRLVSAWTAATPERPFLSEVTGRRASYGETWAGVRRWASWLDELGIGRGDRVVSMLPASIDSVLLWLAAGCAGALEVPADPALRGVFLRYHGASQGRGDLMGGLRPLPGRARGRRGFRDERCELAAQQLPGGSVRELADEDHRVRRLGRPQPGLGELPDFVC